MAVKKEVEFRRERAFTQILEACKSLGWMATTMNDADERCRALIIGEKKFLNENFELAEVES